MCRVGFIFSGAKDIKRYVTFADLTSLETFTESKSLPSQTIRGCLKQPDVCLSERELDFNKA